MDTGDGYLDPTESLVEYWLSYVVYTTTKIESFDPVFSGMLKTDQENPTIEVPFGRGTSSGS